MVILVFLGFREAVALVEMVLDSYVCYARGELCLLAHVPTARYFYVDKLNLA